MAADPHIGTRIRKRRQVLRMTQDELAAELGVSKSTVANWERGKHFPLRYLGALEGVLGISLDGEPQAPPAIVPAYEWERLLLADETLPYAERVQVIEITRRARAGGAPAPGPRPAGDVPRAPGRTA